MEDVTRRGFLGVLGIGAAAVAGCSSRQAAGDEGAVEEGPGEPEERSADVGEEVDVSTKHGDLRVTVDGFETSEALREQEATFSEIPDGETIGVLMALVENVSYDDRYNPGHVGLNGCMRVTDPDGVTISPMGMASPYGQYAPAAGAFFACVVGERVRVAVWYRMDASIEEVSVVFDSPRTTVRVPVGRA